MSEPVQTRLKRLERLVLPIAAAVTALTLSTFRHGYRWLNLKPTGALAITLPKANGKQGEFRLFLGATVGGNLTIRTGNSGLDVISGIAAVQTSSFQSAANTNTITLNATTTGGILGGYIVLQDMGPLQWVVEANLPGSGTAATPFSNT